MGKNNNKINIESEQKQRDELNNSQDETSLKSLTSSLSSDNIDEVEETNSGKSRVSILISLIRSIPGIGVGSDVVNLELPHAFLLPFSTHKYVSTNFCDHFNLLLKANNMTNEYERIMNIFKYIATVNIKIEEVTKKPVNAVIGETMSSNFHTLDLDNENETIKDNYYMVEQLSDNPPMVATCVYNKRLGIRINFVNQLKMIFSGTYIHSPLDEPLKIHFEKFNTTYSITAPTLHARFLRGFIEYCGPCIIKSSTSNVSIVSNNIAKPLIGGSYNSFDGKLYDTAEPITNKTLPLYRIHGKWDTESIVTDCKTNKTAIYKRSDQIPTTYYPIILPTDSSIIWKDLIDSHANGKNLAKAKSRVNEKQKKLNLKPIQFIFNESTGNWELKEYLSN